MTRRRVPPGLVVVVVVVLVAGVLSAVFVKAPLPVERDERESASAASLEALVPELSRFVEQARGLSFKETVGVELLERDAFRTRVTEVSGIDHDELATTGRVLRALGLLEPHVDLAKEVESLLGAAVIGFYDPDSRTLVVRGTQPSPAVRMTLVHELTHALQDQHFDLSRESLDDATDESALGFDGLVEGDAIRIEEMYRDSLPAEEQKAAEREQVLQNTGVGLDTPPVLLQSLIFPYVVGPTFVRAVAAASPTRLDEAFASPPTTSEQLLHPDRFLAGEAARPVEDPPADAEVIERGVLGEFGVLLLLSSEVEQQEMVRASRGWGGDRYVAWDDGERTCVRAAITMDTTDDTRELRAALDTWAGAHGNARIVDSGPITITACG